MPNQFDVFQNQLHTLTERITALERGVVVRPINPTLPLAPQITPAPPPPAQRAVPVIDAIPPDVPLDFEQGLPCGR